MSYQFSKNEIVDVLRDPSETNFTTLMNDASQKTRELYTNKIFTYGFVYYSTYCKNNCNFCYYRKDNNIDRYRKDRAEILSTAKELINSGVNLIDLTAGEDPKEIIEDYKDIFSVINSIKENYDMPVMISPGVVPKDIIRQMAHAGADWYALYQETHNKELFEKLRVNQSYDERMDAKLYAKDKGLLIEEGIMSGVGESYEDVADSIYKMGDIGASQVRVMSFVPQQGSPMEQAKTPHRMLEFKIIALLRLMYPYALIPASLDVDGISGLKDRIYAGANLITSIIPPKSGFMGVAQSTMDVDSGGRTIEEASEILNNMDLRIATNDEYKLHIHKLRTM